VAGKDVQTLAAFFSPDGVLMGANAPAVIGRNAIWKRFEVAIDKVSNDKTVQPNQLIRSVIWT
jgi:ketosteroid isomerase-like protein